MGPFNDRGGDRTRGLRIKNTPSGKRLAEGVPAQPVMRYVWHSNLATTLRYTHLVPEHPRPWSDRAVRSLQKCGDQAFLSRHGQLRLTAAWLTLVCTALACNDQGPQTNNIAPAPMGSWSVKDSIPGARSDIGVATLNGKLYAVGGWYRVDAMANVDVYDPATNTWSSKAPLPTARCCMGVGVVNGVMYAVGGFIPFVGNVGTVEAYDPATDTWTTKAPMHVPRSYLAVGVVNGVLYAVGGYEWPGGR